MKPLFHEQLYTKDHYKAGAILSLREQRDVALWHQAETGLGHRTTTPPFLSIVGALRAFVNYHNRAALFVQSALLPTLSDKCQTLPTTALALHTDTRGGSTGV